MRRIMGLISGIAVVLLLFVSRASAQMGAMTMMGWPTMLLMGLFYLLLLIHPHGACHPLVDQAVAEVGDSSRGRLIPFGRRPGVSPATR